MTRFDAVDEDEDEDEDEDPHDGCRCYFDCPQCPRCDCCTCAICPEEQWEEGNADG